MEAVPINKKENYLLIIIANIPITISVSSSWLHLTRVKSFPYSWKECTVLEDQEFQVAQFTMTFNSSSRDSVPPYLKYSRAILFSLFTTILRKAKKQFLSKGEGNLY